MLVMAVFVGLAQPGAASFLEAGDGPNDLTVSIEDGWVGGPCARTDFRKVMIQSTSQGAAVVLELASTTAQCDPLFDSFRYFMRYRAAPWDVTVTVRDMGGERVATVDLWSTSGGVSYETDVAVNGSSLLFEIPHGAFTDARFLSEATTCSVRCTLVYAHAFGDRLPDAGSFTFP